MELATVREAVNLTNNTKALTPYTLRQVLASYSTTEEVKKLIGTGGGGGGGYVDLKDYAKLSDLPTKTSQLTNDSNFVQAVDGIIPSQYLPSYVDDVLEYSSSSDFPNPGDPGKIYIATSTNITYRWGGSTYVEIGRSLALGTTEYTAFRGDWGLLAYNHISVTGNPHNLTLNDLGITVTADTINYLSGLSENIIVTLAKKLDTAGGVLTGYLTLHHDPVEKLHAATKQYVDNEIDGISVRVTQNITRVEELAGDLESQKKTLSVQAQTIVDVQNDVTGLNQKTENNTSLISTVEQKVNGLSTEVSKTSDTVTTLEATINLLELSLDQDVIVIPVDEDNKPVSTAQYKIGYTIRFRGNVVSPESITIEGSSDGIVITKDSTHIIVDVSNGTPIAKATTGFIIKATYTSTVNYEDGKILTVVLVPKGEQGIPGDDAAIVSDTPPEDTEQLWLDLNDNKLKRYEEMVSEDTIIGVWVVVNDYSNAINTTDDNIKALEEELRKELNELGELVDKIESSSSTGIDQTSDEIKFRFEQVQKQITELAGQITEHVTTQEQYIRFKEGTITLGILANPYQLYLDNDDVIMLKDGTEISRWHQDVFSAKIFAMHDPVLTPGYSFQWVPKSNGSYSLRKVRE